MPNFEFIEPAVLGAAGIEYGCGPSGRRLEVSVLLGESFVPEPASPDTTLLGVWIGQDGSSHMNERPPTYLLFLTFDLADPKLSAFGSISEDGQCDWYRAKLPPPGKTVHVGLKIFDLAGNASPGEERKYTAPRVPKKPPEPLAPAPWTSTN